MKKILIYNPFSKTGHLDSWLLLIAKSFQAEEFEIDILTPDFTVLMKDKNLIFGQLPAGSKAASGRLQMYLRFWDFLQILNEMRAKSWKEISLKNRPGSLRYLAKLTSWSILNFLPSSLFKSNNYPTKVFVLQLNQALVQSKYDSIFVAYLDFLTPSKTFWKYFDEFFRINIYGIKFDTSNLTSHGLLHSSNVKGVFYLDPRIVTKLNSLGFPSYLLPDIASADLPEAEGYVPVIVKRSKRRKIVFLGGAIGKQKNLCLWLELIEKENPSEYFFLQAGKINRSTISEKEEILLEKLSSKENFLVIDKYFDDEREFNQLISISHVIFAVYRAFNLSSNLVTKSIMFRKPILVSRGTLMGEIVEKYKIGLTVDETSFAETSNALARLYLYSLSEAEYQLVENDFSFQKFKASIQNVLK